MGSRRSSALAKSPPAPPRLYPFRRVCFFLFRLSAPRQSVTVDAGVSRPAGTRASARPPSPGAPATPSYRQRLYHRTHSSSGFLSRLPTTIDFAATSLGLGSLLTAEGWTACGCSSNRVWDPNARARARRSSFLLSQVKPAASPPLPCSLSPAVALRELPKKFTRKIAPTSHFTILTTVCRRRG